ncbi:MarR family winged helix-turn-helix transcriptional regulator [Streptomyces sp. NPDC049954]|uniref:MarR family winged helix-turn-helix transcriptional regulator n=1 Tax=Streptomyces sp. NPDC049954 TaxID=3155779 RepID=UPI00343E2DC4
MYRTDKRAVRPGNARSDELTTEEPERPAAQPSPLIDRIERQAAFLNRNFELLHRRSTIHDRLDRAEYLMLRTLTSGEPGATLGGAGPMDINRLAAMLGLDPSTAGRQVAALRRKGLVTTSPDPADRRRSLVTPTGEGLERAAQVRGLRAEGFVELLDGWSEDDLRALGDLFQKYNRAVARRYLTHEP